MVVVEVPTIELLQELFTVMEFPPFTKTLRIENCREQYCCLLHLPALQNGSSTYPPIDFQGHSPVDYLTSANLAASGALAHLGSILKVNITDFSSAQVAEIEMQKQLINAAKTTGYAAMEMLNVKYAHLKDIYDAVVRTFDSISIVLTGRDVPRLIGDP
ncbi:hypothetical protein M5689_024731 [Euphorbia peplus]|nr:hypothetical protein M5689_024731 [Euphorbia peplus]